MSNYQTRTATQTATQAKRLSSRIAAELTQVRALYGKPTNEWIDAYDAEAEAFLAADYLDYVRYGFERNGMIVFELVYTAHQASGVDDKPGRIPPDANVQGATWFSYLVWNTKYDNASPSERAKFIAGLPFQRTGGAEPRLASGVYTRGSKRFSEETLGLDRTVRSL